MIILHQQSLKQYNTFWIDCIAKQLCILQSLDDLKEFWAMEGEKVILGWGSNILITKDIDIVWINHFSQEPICVVHDGHTLVEVKSGYVRDDFVQWCLEHKYWGYENMALIPGTIGAWVLGNIWAYGKEISDYISSIEYIDLATMQVHSITKEQCQFSYRRSIFKTMKHFFIKSVIFSFPNYNTNEPYIPHLSYADIEKEMQSQWIIQSEVSPKKLYEMICQIRMSKMPSRDTYGTAWSFFKNPTVSQEKLEQLKLLDPNIKYFPFGEHYKLAAWYLLDTLGFRWKIIWTDSWWKVWCYENQALLVINQGATGTEILDFTLELESAVKNYYGVTLEREVIVI